MLDQRCALALNVARQQLMHLSLAEFKALVRDQFFVLQLEPDRAVEALASMVPEADARKELLKQVHAIVGAGDPPLAAERDRLARLSQVLAVPIEKTVAPATSGRTSARQGDRRPPRCRAERKPLCHAAPVGRMSHHADHREQDVQRDRCRRHRVGPAHVAGARFEPGQPPSAKWHACRPGECQEAAGIVTAILTALVGSALPGPGPRSVQPRCRSTVRCRSVRL